jgi:protein TonB
MKFVYWLFWMASAALLLATTAIGAALVFTHEKKDHGTLQQVDLLSADDAKEDKKKDEQPKAEKPPEIQTQDEKPPDATELLKSLDVAPIDNSPALEAASLGAMEAALSGQGGGGDFGEALSFSSGGRIGGTGIASTTSEKLEQAFSMSEIDQKPRAVFQESPAFPAEMRGKKIEGVVTVLFVVDSSGKVDQTRVEKASASAFESPALSAVKKWKFEPGVRAGQRVASKMRVTIRFPAE